MGFYLNKVYIQVLLGLGLFSVKNKYFLNDLKSSLTYSPVERC